jgi:acetyl esterase/lipase
VHLGNLALATCYQIIEKNPNYVPAGIVMLSPWLDLTRKHSLVSPNKSTDWLLDHDKDSTRTGCVDLYCGRDIKDPSDPRVSLLLREPHKLLPKQFLSAGKAEVQFQEPVLWAKKCIEKLGPDSVECDFAEGQVHTFAIGGWLADAGVEASSDRKLLSFVRHQVE